MLWLVVLTVPAGQVAEETVIEAEEDEDAEKLPLTKKPRTEETTAGAEEGKVTRVGVGQRGQGKDPEGRTLEA